MSDQAWWWLGTLGLMLLVAGGTLETIHKHRDRDQGDDQR